MKRHRFRSRVPHSKRPEVRYGAVHVTMRLRGGLPSMRTPRTYRVLERAFRAGKERNGLRLVHYSVLSNHLHLLVDVHGTKNLSRGMQGLAIRVAKALNRHWRKKGRVFADRFHASLLETVTQIRRATRYVLLNARKHGIRISAGRPDRYSSARWFPCWQEKERVKTPLRSPPVARASNQLMDVAFMRGLSLDELPGPEPIGWAWTAAEILG